jgi:hypothetical protein
LLNAPKISAPVTPKTILAGLLLNNGIAIILKEKILVAFDRKVEVMHFHGLAFWGLGRCRPC